jgi:2-(1,2-epoxy-1,2-dihydrophenyl)acetyl-CoA isomerase
LEFKDLLFEQSDAVATIRLNRPRSRNAFNQSLTDELGHAIRRVAEDDAIRVVILTGEGRSFSAGADLVDRESRWRDPEEGLLRGFLPSIDAIMEMPKPVIAAVGGAAAGIGAAFALAADLSLMADDAYLLLAFSNIGLVPDGGCHWLLSRTVGHKLAFQIAVEGERIPAARCLELGLCNRVVPAAELQAEALAWARRLASRAPLSMRYTKEIMRAAQEASFHDSYRLEAIRQNACVNTDDHREGVEAFREKRAPHFRGR